MIASAIMIFMLPVFGDLSDTIGRRRMFGDAGLLIGILCIPVVLADGDKIALLIWIAITVPFAIVYPARLRTAGGDVLGAVRHTRALYRSLVRVSVLGHLRERADADHRHRAAAGDGKPWLICAYILVVSIISAFCVYAMPETLKRDMAVDSK